MTLVAVGFNMPDSDGSDKLLIQKVIILFFVISYCINEFLSLIYFLEIIAIY